MALLTLEDAKAALRIDTDTDDDQLQMFCAAAKAILEDIVGPVDPVERTEYFDGGDRVLLLGAYDVDVTEIVFTDVDGDTTLTAGADYTVNSAAGIVYAGGVDATDRTRFNIGARNIAVTYTAGSDTPAANFQLAAIELVRVLWQEGRQPDWPTPPQSESDATWVPGFSAVRRKVIELCGSQRKARRWAG